MHPDLTQRHALLLGALSQGLAADLAISPVLVACQPGLGILAAVQGIAAALGMARTEIRCGQINAGGFGTLGTHLDEITAAPSIVFLCDADANPEATIAVMEAIVERAKAPVLVVVQCGMAGERTALGAIQDGLGIHPAHVPTARLAIEPVEQPVLLFGHVDQIGAKTDERTYSIEDGTTAYVRETRFTVVMADDQDGDSFADALEAIHAPGSGVAVRAEIRGGFLHATTADMTTS